ncbi:hypothetical protein HanXRQr2_Chr01g0004301 [Helianthus annuus]|uniref:Uncharacterized protein n=1 Tax=Helianthus annuus TaxID=4232 RepID=A0A9K3P1Q5_HELAN|nr:hypothetical protein HanXRQr2_Chr01g0004301 [Helianthus annuus]
MSDGNEKSVDKRIVIVRRLASPTFIIMFYIIVSLFKVMFRVAITLVIRFTFHYV